MVRVGLGNPNIKAPLGYGHLLGDSGSVSLFQPHQSHGFPYEDKMEEGERK